MDTEAVREQRAVRNIDDVKEAKKENKRERILS